MVTVSVAAQFSAIPFYLASAKKHGAANA